LHLAQVPLKHLKKRLKIAIERGFEYMYRKLAISSFVLNLILFAIIGYAIHLKGGIPYVMDYVSAKVSDNEFDDYYKTRLSIFKESEEKDVIFLGDSLTDYNEWAESFPEVIIGNQGIGDDTTSGVLYRLKETTNLKPSKLFIMIGINDLINGVSRDDILKNYTSIIEEIKKDTPNTEVYIQSLLPTNSGLTYKDVNKDDILWLNDNLRKLAAESGYTYINLYSLFGDGNDELSEEWTVDGIHLNGPGYGVWEKDLEDYVVDR
jgi:lysophospholipase L1-like esterase